MVVGEASINNIMGGIENTGSVRLHNHKRKLKQRFDIIKKLGQGTYGKVQLGINKETGQEVAIKTIKKSKIETEADLIRIRREIQIMSSVQHPNIIHIYEVFENREKMVLVMEYAAGGELYDYLSERKVLVEEEARRIFRQISTACYYCHKHKICHRDLKLENILLDENRNAKIADFGLSNVFDDHRLLSTFCGSPLYASPEIVKGTPYHGPEADCWSLGVLLYTLVYGAMPFDGSNFKRLVKQISQGDYFEPKNPSPASPLIQEMLTVNAKNRANIEKICAHWWVNEGYEESCLDISEDLANQTPVRLDVLLSLNPPPPQLESDQLVVAGEANDEQMKAEPAAPTRSQSAGSLLMDVSNPAERRIKELIAPDVKVPPPKRKLETTPSTEQANATEDGKRKEKIVKERTVAGIPVSGHNEEPPEDVKMTEVAVKNGMETVESLEAAVNDPNLQGAACAELIEEAKKSEIRKPVKVKKTMSSSVSNKILEEINENPSQESLHNHSTNTTTTVDNDKNKENQPVPVKQQPQETVKTEPVLKDDKEKDSKTTTPVKKKIVKKKVLSDKNETVKPTTDGEEKKPKEKEKEDVAMAEPPSKPVERRQSRIFEQAEKFQSMIQDNKSQSTMSPEKPKKIIIPGVSVGGFKKEFERKASLKNVSPPKIKTTMSKKHVIEDKVTPVEPEQKAAVEEVAKTQVETTPAAKTTEPVVVKEEQKKEESKAVEPPIAAAPVVNSEDVERKLKMKNAVSIISNALDKEGARKSKSRPCMSRKPPVPFGASGRSASGSIAMISSPISPPPDIKRFLKLQPGSPPTMPLSSTPEQVKQAPEPALPPPPENQTSSAEITLKSATLPRRKSTKAEIQLDYPKTTKPPTMEFKTEMAHQVQVPPPPTLSTQRSEVMFPVNTPPINIGLRSSSLEPESRIRERIIPIAFEKANEAREPLQSPPTKPPVPRGFQTQKSTSTQRSNSLSRQSTQESDSETTASGGDPIKKSPREYIIPIAVEGGGYVTPRAGSLEPSDTSSTVTNSSRKTTGSKFSRPRRMMSLFDRDGSEDESPFGTLHRHSSFGKDSDTEGDSRKDSFHMHRLRSSRPRKATLEHNDSLSSGEDDDDEDGFEFLTAENLFSTLLSRVRDLTQRINTDENPRPGFPNSRLLSHFDHGNFWNRMEPLGSRNSPLGRQFSRERSVSNSSSATAATPWRRSVSRDLASDIDSVFADPRRTPTHTATLPRGGKVEEDRKENLNLSDLNLKKLKLTEEDALALSYLTPGLSRRIQKQLFASLPASEARKISRTLSMRDDVGADVENRRVSASGSSTLPRRFSFDKRSSSQQNLTGVPNSLIGEGEITPDTSYLSKPRYQGLREPMTREYRSKYSLRSPDSSISEVSSITDDSYPYGPESTSLGKYVHSSSILENTKSLENPKPTRKISRFLRPDFYDPPKEDNLVVKEKKEREMETQKVLKEIRDKRIKNRISMRRERSLSREKSLDGNGNDENMVRCKDLVDALTATTQDKYKLLDGESRVKEIKREDERDDNRRIACNFDGDGGKTIEKGLRNNARRTISDDSAIENSNQRLKTTEENSLNSVETESLLQDVSDNIRNIESNVLSNTQQNGTIKKERISKLIRPKSYPTENGAQKPTMNTKRSPEKSPTEAKLNQKSPELSSPAESKLSTRKVPEKTETTSESNEKPSTDIEKSTSDSKSLEISNNKLPKKIARRSSEIKPPDIPSTEKSSLDNKAHRKSLDIKYVGKSFDAPSSGIKINGKSVKESKPNGKSSDAIIKASTNEVTTSDSKPNGKLLKIKSLDNEKCPDDTNKQHRKSSPDIKYAGKSSEILAPSSKLINKSKSSEKTVKTKSPRPDETKVLAENSNEKSKASKLKKSTSQPTDKPLSTKNKFLHSIEKKIEKLRTFNNEDKKSGGVETTIKRLREQSVPRNVDHITESTLIKRAVSVEDFSNVKQNKTLQPSRKSVTKILGLFKKYEDRTPKEENGADPLLGNITETNIPKPVDKERPKSLQVEKVKPMSKLPVNSHRKSLNLDDNNKSLNNNNNNNNEPDRKNLKLDFSNINKETQDVNLNRISYTTDESSTLLSPCDETTSCDSWSVCSDYHHTQELSSPLSPNGNTYSGDENESVIDRIRRKSFYTRFNDKPKPKPRKSLIGNYKDLDLYKEYNQKTLPRYKISRNNGGNSGYTSSGEMLDHEYRPYVRSKSVSSEYSGSIPNRYQTYNPRRSNASSLYAHEDSNLEDLSSTTGIYKKYSYTPNTSRLGSLSRASRSPSSDFQYIPHHHHHPHTSTSLSPPQTAENGHTVTEHAV